MEGKKEVKDDEIITEDDDDIINEDNVYIDYDILEKLVNNYTKKCVCKIFIKLEMGKVKTGSGFFCNIKLKNLKYLLQIIMF